MAGPQVTSVHSTPARPTSAHPASPHQTPAERAPAQQAPGPDAVTAMLEARSIALVGASQRPGSLGERMVAQVAASPAQPRLYLVNPRYREIGGHRCHPGLADLPEPVDLVLLAVPDAALEEQLTAAASRGDRSAVIFGGGYDVPGQPPGLRSRLASIARSAGMAVCGAGCMGFVNLARGLRAIGYAEPEQLPAGPVALVTHSGSVFSTMLRARRGFGFSVVVSSGQELVTSAAAYARYALTLPQTRVLGLVLEAIRDASLLRAVLADADAAGVPVVLLAAGGSGHGRELVAAHSGALAAGDGAWEALASAYGVHRVGDLAELADTLELFTLARRPARSSASGHADGAAGAGSATGPAPYGKIGVASVHDSGLERAHVADLAEHLGVPFAGLGERTRQRLAALLDPGLEPGNPLDLWGTGRDTERLFAEALTAMAGDPAVAAVALAVDLVPEFDGDESYPLALLAAAERTSKPLTVLAGLAASVDPVAAARLRAAGIPVLEGACTGLLALRHLLNHTECPTRQAIPGHPAATPPTGPGQRPGPGQAGLALGDGSGQASLAPGDGSGQLGAALAGSKARRDRWLAALADGPLDAVAMFGLLRDYGVRVARVEFAASRDAALAAAAAIGYPVVLKTGEPGVAHKSDVGGVLAGLDGPAALAAGYDDLADRLGPRVLVCQTVPAGTEILVGISVDPALGPLVVVGAGGVLAELLADRSVALPPVTRAGALAMLTRLRVSRLLAGARGRPPADLESLADAITAVSVIAVELGDALAALDINPLICTPSGAIAVDVLAVPRP